MLSSTRVTQLDLRASFLERAEDDARDLILKASRVASRLDELLSDQNQRRMMDLVDTFQQTLARYGTLSRELEPTVRAVPALVDRTQATVESVRQLAGDLDQKLGLLDALTATANEVGATTEDLHRNTLPRINALLDEGYLPAEIYEQMRTKHEEKMPGKRDFVMRPYTMWRSYFDNGGSHQKARAQRAVLTRKPRPGAL